MEYLYINAIFILCFGALGFLFGREGDRAFSGIFCLVFALGASVWAWIAFVVTHFVLKYW